MVRGIRWIWVVVCLMALALLGIMWTQTRWIKSSIDFVETKFNKEVSSALTNVSKVLEANVNDLDMQAFVVEPLKEVENELVLSDTSSTLSQIKLSTDLKRSKFQKYLANKKIKSAQQNYDNRDIKDLIQIEALDYWIRHHLEKRDIKTAYHYGVYSNKDKAFFIKDGSYAVSDFSDGEASVTNVNTDLLSTPYNVDIFVQDTTALGKLMISFPTKKKVLFQKYFKNILLSTFLTLITIFCFGYTVYTILRQKQLSEMKTDFINNMTHEFKTPIATISLATDSIKNPKIIHDDKKVTRFVDIIKQENMRMLDQVEKVLQMAIIDRNDIELKVMDVDMHELLQEAASHANLQIEKREGSLDLDLQASNHVIEGDENHLSNIMHNLLDNANKYSPDKPNITVKSWNTSSEFVFSICDKGLGMTKDQVKNIFEKFYRVNTGNVHNVKGFGLGLSYVKAMVENHGGKILVDSQLGQGSCFEIHLPLHQKTKRS